jgi:hypothetical protein
VTLELTLFALRIASGLLLLSLLLAVFWILWRDYRAVAAQAQVHRRIYGHLVELANIGEEYIPTGQTHRLRPLTNIGRSPTNHIVIDDTTASSAHAMIGLREGHWWLEDKNSRNGTLLNGEQITAPTIVTDGDIISIGKAHFKITLEI